MVKTLILTLLAAAPTMAADVVMQPTRLALFKNGYGFVTLTGTLGEETRTRLGPLPRPSAGTLWVGLGQGAELRSLVAGMSEFVMPNTGRLNMGYLIAANPGRKVSISYSASNDQIGHAAGTILPVPGQMERAPGNVIGETMRPEPGTPHSPLLLLRTESGGTVVVATHDISNITFEGECQLPEYVELRPAVELELTAPAPGVSVEATCLTAGISWQPSYRFDLGEDGRGTLTAKATISNNLMDIAGAEVELITGHPSLEQADEVDPIALQGIGAQRLRSGRDGFSTRQAVVMTNNNFAPEAEEAPAAPMPMAAPEEGVQTADLFFYPLKDFSARAGEVVGRPLFSVPGEYRSVYVWEVGDPQRFTTRTPGEVQSHTEVWHCIRFTNPLEMPLTTAHVEFLEQGRIAGTNTVSYTPAGRECTTRMNHAVNVPVQKKSELIDQQRVSLPHYGGVTRNTSKVTLTLTNGTAGAIDAEILQRVNGVVRNAGEGEVQTTGSFSGPNRSNPATVVRWKLHLEPGQSSVSTQATPLYTGMR